MPSRPKGRKAEGDPKPGTAGNGQDSGAQPTWRDRIRDFMVRYHLLTGHATSLNDIMNDPNEVTSPEPASGTDGPHHKIKLKVSMKYREIAFIALRNAILNILTLTLYRFWARTRVRRYLWSRINLMGEPIEYTGTSLELFLGFLKILIILVIPLVGLSMWMQLFVDQNSPLSVPYGIAVYLGLAFLYGVAKYRTQRYRLSRTYWRGIRMGLKGSWTVFGVRMLLFIYLTIATLFWAYPLQRFVLIRQMMKSTTFGDREFQFEGDPTELYPSFAIAWFLSIIGLGVGYVTGGVYLNEVMENGLVIPWMSPDDTVLNLSTDQFTYVLLASAIIYVVTLVVLAFTLAWYRAKELTFFAKCMRLDGLQFELKTNGLAVLFLNLGNAIILIFTFGFGLPIAQMRTFKFWFSRLKAEGNIDVDSIAQGDAPDPWVGEGLAEFFDIGAV